MIAQDLAEAHKDMQARRREFAYAAATVRDLKVAYRMANDQLVIAIRHVVYLTATRGHTADEWYDALDRRAGWRAAAAAANRAVMTAVGPAGEKDVARSRAATKLAALTGRPRSYWECGDLTGVACNKAGHIPCSLA